MDENINVLSAGERFTFKGFEWVVLDHVGDGVLAIMTGMWKETKFDEDTNNYAKSSLRKQLLSDLLPVLGEENLIAHDVDLVADNGDDRYGMVRDKVFILSCDEYRKYRNVMPKYENWIWTCTPWYINDSGGGNFVRIVGTSGFLYGYGACYSGGVSPACIFASEHLKLRRQAQMVEV